MYYTAYLLAWRYLFGRRDEGTINTMVYICFFSILVGTCALTLSMCIMNGFEKATYRQLQGIHSDITMHAYGQALDVSSIQEVLMNEFHEDIISSSPYLTKQIIIQTENSDDISHVIALKAIDPYQESQVSTIEQKIISDQKNLPTVLKDHYILIGQGLAQQLNLSLGDTLFLLFPSDQSRNSSTINLQKESAVIAGIFKTGIDEFDSNVIYGSFNLIEKMDSQYEITHMSLRTRTHKHHENIIERLHHRFNIDVYSWKDLYPAIVSALKLEKYVTFFILGLIILLASINILSLLFMYITHKKRDISILRAIGAPHQTIQQIFFIIGMSISLVASLLGLLFAALIGLLLQRYPCISLPDTYYVTHIPVDMQLNLFFYIWCFVLTLSFLANWYSMKNIKYMNIARILRFEA